ncbi:Protein IQ-DOMAIN like [Heracleum sosnowskyi]|uniref:Protein IQ-DOMAIN like n=1 Tax=Heracleum sosnowskyi TaxID=360622 RepID=A0AAD8HKC3_9APIA|nr:Protein IQ-DOMAIN like [Heracleum sosnowskyi]
MGSGGWLKKFIGSKKEKNVNAKSLKECSQKESSNTSNNIADEKLGAVVPFDDIAAIRIQSAFRAYKARKILRHLKGTSKLHALTLDSSVSKQASATLRHLHAWSKIQSEIRTRRISMATEARIRQKNLDNQLKLDAKLHDLEVEWDCGTKTMEESVTSIYVREAAVVKRERTMAYAFSHQWRANSNPVLNNNEFGNAIWGWSWTERWMAALPWESRALVQSSPKKTVSKQSSKNSKNLKSPTMKPMLSVKSISPNGKGTIKVRKLSYGKPDQEAIANKEQMAC